MTVYQRSATLQLFFKLDKNQFQNIIVFTGNMRKLAYFHMNVAWRNALNDSGVRLVSFQAAQFL